MNVELKPDPHSELHTDLSGLEAAEPISPEEADAVALETEEEVYGEPDGT